LTAVEQKLPFLISLTNAERKALYKTGAERLSFIQTAAQAVQDNPDILPQTFDAAGFQNGIVLFSMLTEINTLAAQLASKIDDTHMDVGAQALDGASDVYNYVKAAAKKTPGLKPLADQLGQLYQKATATRRANKKAKIAAVATK
jgi:hypothetical protein